MKNRTIYADRNGRLQVVPDRHLKQTVPPPTPRRPPKRPVDRSEIRNDQIRNRVKRIDEFIRVERNWREKVFPHDPRKRARKVEQCDKRLEDLQALRDYIRKLEQQAGVQTDPGSLL